MKVKVLKVEVENKGKYKQANVTYYNVERNTEANTRLVSFGDGQKVFLEMVQAKEGDLYEVEMKQNGNFWNWVSAVKTTVEAPTKPAVNTSPKSTYETPEERAVRQVYIVRQTSLERAMEYFTLVGNKKVDSKDVIYLADTFTHYVLNGGDINQDAVDTVFDIDSDVPV